jgi:hypothetical protein
MAKKGKQVKHTYKIKHADKWKALMAIPEPVKVTAKESANINQLWRWDTLEDVAVK